MSDHNFFQLNRRIVIIILALGFFQLLLGCSAQGSIQKVQVGAIQLDIRETRWELRPGLSTSVWSYNGIVPGTPIIVNKGDRVVIDGVNRLPVTTNIHWHGLIVPNDQDGPAKIIRPGTSFHYEFIAEESGTYWYHSHFRPTLIQVDMGLYGPFIIKAPEDDKYSGDHILIFDDWYLDGTGRRLLGSADGMIERSGNIETVNGKTGTAIPPLKVREGELHKLRFINASTAAVHTLHLRGGNQFRVTHTDGHPLVEPYMTPTLVLSPAERFDVELAATGTAGQTWIIDTDRPQLGIRIPIVFLDGKVAPVSSPFAPPTSKIYAGIDMRKPNFVLELNSSMGMMGGGQGMRGMVSMGNMGGMQGMESMMRWTINGKSYPDTDPLQVKVGEVVKLRFINKDTQMMHPMDHPMHVHGTYFQIVSQNGRKPNRETWKDTVNVPANEYLDIAFVMKNPGEWMLHCHILDHEDAGLMTTVIAK